MTRPLKYGILSYSTNQRCREIERLIHNLLLEKNKNKISWHALSCLTLVTQLIFQKINQSYKVNLLQLISLYNFWYLLSSKLSSNSFFFNASEFNWTDTHNVLEVTTKTEYDACVKTNGILEDTSPATFNLTKDGTYYYICTIRSHCDLGQKVTIVVGNGSSPPISMPNNHAALSAVLSTITIVAASLVHLCSFLLY